MTRQISTITLTLIAFMTVATVLAQEPSKGPGDAPVRKELDEFREKSARSAPPERIRVYEQGIEEVRKSWRPLTRVLGNSADRRSRLRAPDPAGRKAGARGCPPRGPAGSSDVVPRGLVPLL